MPLLKFQPSYIMGRSVHTVKENAETLKVAIKEIGLEGNADKTVLSVVWRSECRMVTI